MKAALYLRIDQNVLAGEKTTYYRLEKMLCDADTATSIWRLHKPEGPAYDVIQLLNGTITCDCDDYNRRAEPQGFLCKHGRAVLELLL